MTANPYIIAAIAISGTLLGVVITGIFQSRSLRRQLRSQSTAAELKRLAELEHWAHTALEDRHKILWTERKALYTRLIGLTEKWIRCNVDLSGTELPDDVDVQNYEDAANASPAVARYFEASHSFTECLYEIEILGHVDVVAAARQLHLSLIRGARKALEGSNEREHSEAAKRHMLQAMRRGLTE